VLGIRDATHEESDPEGQALVISRLACSLVGQTERVQVLPGTLARRAYGADEVREQFRCNFGLNPAYRDQIGAGTLQVSGVGPLGEVRIVELSDHPFFLATLYLPQLSSSPDRPHPLILAYLRAARAARAL
jgi:CTP synthase (UTP-ammonia lyase)